MRKLLAAAMVVGALGLGLGTPTASAKPHDDWCGGGCGHGHWDNNWNPGWNNGWYPGRNISACVTGPWRYVTICI